MAFQAQSIQCKDCGAEFQWSAEEQEFYQEKGFNPPLRCKDCRAKARANFNNNGGGGGGGDRGPRESFPIKCSNCGKDDTVPFQPRGDKPVLCRDCFRQNR